MNYMPAVCFALIMTGAIWRQSRGFVVLGMLAIVVIEVAKR